ncbi:unnamed protein product [Allacma fusca]|uniref:Uncharacterized protein n=1 Tax=Allacma fusca TaxID=39272 RepID=A0A8J2JIZ0_9HEXA|nr:unnamed protein product [Allacma fusca]
MLGIRMETIMEFKRKIQMEANSSKSVSPVSALQDFAFGKNEDYDYRFIVDKINIEDIIELDEEYLEVEIIYVDAFRLLANRN